MIYRIDKFIEGRINPITAHEYDTSWIILILTDSNDYEKMCGSNNECAYTVKISRAKYIDWETAIGDFISFCESNGKNAILVMSETELNNVKEIYNTHRYNEPLLRDGLLIRDGCHIKVKDILPLNPYLIWTATWENIGLDSQVSTPKIFSQKSDQQFKKIFNM